MYPVVPKLLSPAIFQIKPDGTEIFGEMGGKDIKNLSNFPNYYSHFTYKIIFSLRILHE